MLLYGLAFLMIVLPTEMRITQNRFGLTPLDLNEWLLCAGFAFALLLVDEVIKFFLRRRRHQGAAVAPGPATATSGA